MPSDQVDVGVLIDSTANQLVMRGVDVLVVEDANQC